MQIPLLFVNFLRTKCLIIGSCFILRRQVFLFLRLHLILICVKKCARCSQQQEPGESFDRYLTTLCQIADKCAFDAITPDDLLRDRIIFGIADSKVRERPLREPELNHTKTLDICRASVMSQAQIKAVSEFNSSTFSRKTRSRESQPESTSWKLLTFRD